MKNDSIKKEYSTIEVFTEDNYFRPFGEDHIPSFYNLSEHFRKIYSQSYEDSVLDHIYSIIEPRKKYYVEFGGAIDQCHGNTTHLRTLGWEGLLMDGDEIAIEKSGGLDIKHEWITSKNIMSLFEKHNVPENFDFLSIDIDGDDIYIFDAIDTEKYTPSVVIGEYNPGLPNHLPLAIIEGRSDYGNNPFIPKNHIAPAYHGCNIHAWYVVAKRKGYSVITCTGVNVVMIRNDFVDKFTIPSLKDIVYPPYMQREYHRFSGPKQYFDERFVWRLIE